MNKVYLQTHIKAKNWQYEREFRLSNTFGKVVNDDERKVYFKDEFVDCVMLGMKVSEIDKKEILSICSKKNWQEYQVFQVPFTFILNRERIS